MVIVAVMWFNWRNKQEKYLSTKIERPKQDDDVKYTYKTVASFQREKITDWYTWSSQQWDATTEETIKLRQLTRKETTKHNNDCLNTEREKCHYVISRGHAETWTAQSEESSSRYSPTQIPLCAVVNIEISCSNACRNAGIVSIGIIFSLMKSGKLVDFLKAKKIGGLGAL